MDKNYKEKILKMNESEWKQFRDQKWLSFKKTIAEQSLPPPAWFLATREKYIKFCEAKTAEGKLNATITIQTSEQKKILLNLFDRWEKNDEISMNEELWVECSPKDQWELYRIHKWNTLNGDKTFSLAPPKDFMSNQQ